MLHTLEHRARLVALEAYAVENVADLVRGVTGDISTAFSDVAARFKPTEPGLQLSPQRTNLARQMDRQSYTALRPLVCFVPEGLKVNYLEFSSLLVECASFAADTTQPLLNSFATYLANLVNNRNAFSAGATLMVQLPQSSNPKAPVVSLHDIRTLRETNLKRLGKCFKPGDHTTQVTLADVVSRNNDWPVVFGACDKALKALNGVDRKALDKKMHECVDLLGVVAKMVERSEFRDASPQVARSLADGAFEAASQLEFFSVVYYRAASFIEAVNATVANLLRILDDQVLLTAGK